MPRMNMGRRMYAEAFPAIDITTLERQVKSDRPVCVWHCEYEVAVGFIEVAALGEDRLEFEHVFYGAPNVEQGEASVEIPLACADRAAYKGRPSMICPGCSKSRQKLFYVHGSWMCSKCHDLTTATRLTGQVVHQMRRKLELEVIQRLGRQKGQHASSFQRLMDELESFDEIDVLDWHKYDLFYLQVPQWLSRDDRPDLDDDDVPEHWWGLEWYPGHLAGFELIRWLARHPGQAPSEVSALRRERRHAEQEERKAEAVPPPAKRISPTGLIDSFRALGLDDD